MRTCITAHPITRSALLRGLTILALGGVLLGGLAACGKKPEDVTRPATFEPTTPEPSPTSPDPAPGYNI